MTLSPAGNNAQFAVLFGPTMLMNWSREDYAGEFG